MSERFKSQNTDIVSQNPCMGDTALDGDTACHADVPEGAAFLATGRFIYLQQPWKEDCGRHGPKPKMNIGSVGGSADGVE